MSNEVLTYDCHADGTTHKVPGPDVRILKIGEGGFVVACNCGPESVEEADNPPHATDDHLVNVYYDDPSPKQWLTLERAANGWYGNNRWESPDGNPKTYGQLRAEARERIADHVGADDGRDLAFSPDDREVQARKVKCPNCGAGGGSKCKRPSGHRVRDSHAGRIEAAIEAGIIDQDTDKPSNSVEQATLGECTQ